MAVDIALSKAQHECHRSNKGERGADGERKAAERPPKTESRGRELTEKEKPTEGSRNSEKLESATLFYLLVTLGGIGGVVFLATFFRASLLAELDPMNVRGWGVGAGGFGDAFGFPTSLFTAAAFLGLLITVRLQRKELESTQQALHLQRKDTDRLVREVEERASEERFFKLLEVVRATSRRRVDEVTQETKDRLFKMEMSIRVVLDHASKEDIDVEEIRNLVLQFRDGEEYGDFARYFAAPEFVLACKAASKTSARDDYLAVLWSAALPTFGLFFLMIVLIYKVTNPQDDDIFGTLPTGFRDLCDWNQQAPSYELFHKVLSRL